jgi:hypothetical protein
MLTIQQWPQTILAFKDFLRLKVYNMTLYDLIENTMTDKNTLHSYIGLYELLLANKQQSAKNVLEIGVLYGGSIKLWYDYFPNATIYGLDQYEYHNLWTVIKNNSRIILNTSSDAYNEEFFNDNFLSKGIKFDFMLDDGPHTLESMKTFIKLYSQVMADDGILIIEDLQNIDWIDELKNVVPDNLKEYVKTYDLRNIKGRYDDIVFTIDKSKSILSGA